jgi:Stress-induced bacterial acidophilic repeat motif
MNVARRTSIRPNFARRITIKVLADSSFPNSQPNNMSTTKTAEQVLREDDAIIAGLVRDLAAANAKIRQLSAQQGSGAPRATKTGPSAPLAPAKDTDEPPMRSDLLAHEAIEHPKGIPVSSANYQELLKDRMNETSHRGRESNQVSERKAQGSQEQDAGNEVKFRESRANIEEFGETQDVESDEQSSSRGRSSEPGGAFNHRRSSKDRAQDSSENPKQQDDQGDDKTTNYFKYLQHHDPDKLSRIGEKGGHNSHKNDGKRSRSRSRSRQDDEDDSRQTKRQKIQA